MAKAKNQAKKPNTRLIIAPSEQEANLYWATKFLAPDPIVFIEHRKKKYLILNDLELDRGRKEAKVDYVLSYGELEKKARKRKDQAVPMMDVLSYFLHQKNASEVAVPYNFPFAYAKALQKRKIKLTPLEDPFYQERLIKSDAEKKAIKRTQQCISESIQAAYQVLKNSKIKGNRIYWRNTVLTSEILKSVINSHLLDNNCLGKHTIVAGANQGVDPHCEGSGPLRPHHPIIIDVFPKSMDSQYHGDMTRTVVKGSASDKVKKQWGTVKFAQEKAIKMVKAGVDGQDIHQWIVRHFESEGYFTGVKNGRMQGFFHGTGHGLGIDVHEAPRVSRISNILKAGNVITIEPGLYYHGVGGVRIEDVVYVKKDGREVLAKCPKIMEIA